MLLIQSKTGISFTGSFYSTLDKIWTQPTKFAQTSTPMLKTTFINPCFLQTAR